VLKVNPAIVKISSMHPQRTFIDAAHSRDQVPLAQTAVRTMFPQSPMSIAATDHATYVGDRPLP